jgi:ABC-2 type transport system ATP-binding protein
MLESDPDILLIDEVLTVGDQAFREKSAQAMTGLRERGKTIVLVTHSMSAVEELCTRAMLIEGGQVARVGDPGEIASAYLEVNLDRGEESDAPTLDPGQLGVPMVKIVQAQLNDADGDRRASIKPEETIEITAKLEVVRPVREPNLHVMIRTWRGRLVAAMPSIPVLDGDSAVLRPGDDPTLRLRIENRLVPGRYTAQLAVTRPARRVKSLPASLTFELPFEVSGTRTGEPGSIALRQELSVETSPSARRRARVG